MEEVGPYRKTRIIYYFSCGVCCCCWILLPKSFHFFVLFYYMQFLSSYEMGEMWVIFLVGLLYTSSRYFLSSTCSFGKSLWSSATFKEMDIFCIQMEKCDSSYFFIYLILKSHVIGYLGISILKSRSQLLQCPYCAYSYNF